jgi:hypothetical protein
MKRHMKAQVAREDVSYEVSFRRPLLDWANAALPLFQSLYDRLSENFSLTLADVAVHADPRPAYAVASIRLFGGAGAVELRPDRWRATFRNLRSDEDRKIVMRCLSLLESGVEAEGRPPEMQGRETPDRHKSARSLVAMASWYVCEGGATAVTELLNRHGSLGTPISQGFLGAEDIDFNVNPRLRNPREGWDVTFLIQPSLIEGTHLFANYSGTYIDGGRYNSIEQRAEHARLMLTGMLEKIDVELTNVA